MGKRDVKTRAEDNLKKAHMKNTRKIRKYNKIDARNEITPGTDKEHETNKGENTHVEEDAVCIFCQENFLNTVSVERRFHVVFEMGT